jgi:hypothetical protein
MCLIAETEGSTVLDLLLNLLFQYFLIMCLVAETEGTTTLGLSLNLLLQHLNYRAYYLSTLNHTQTVCIYKLICSSVQLSTTS